MLIVLILSMSNIVNALTDYTTIIREMIINGFNFQVN